MSNDHQNPFPVYLPTQRPLPGEPIRPEENKTLLFSPLTVRGLQLRHRIVVSPMCMYSSKDGFFNDFHFVHLGIFALKGASLIFTEATAVAPQGRISPEDAGLWSDAHIPSLKRIVDFAHHHGSLLGVQLAHAGRKASMRAPFADKGYGLVQVDEGGWPSEVVGPSTIAYDAIHATPKELTLAEIETIQQQFVDAAHRALAAGVDVLEIHGAHGYLIHEFLSGNSNHRTDAYGGSFANRARFAIQIATSVRAVWPADKPLWFRVSATDWRHAPESLGRDPDGWDVFQTIELARELAKVGVDVIDVSSGANLPWNREIRVGPGYQVVFAEAVKKAVPEIKVATVGLITEPRQAEGVLQDGKADVVMLARGFLKDPSWVLNAARELGVDVEWLRQHSRAKPKDPPVKKTSM